MAEHLIRNLSDLEYYSDHDPYMLPSRLHGDARFAWVQHWWRAGMFMDQDAWRTTPHGFPLSAVMVQHDGGDITQGFVHWPHEGHRLIVGTPGSGKFTAGIAPLLLDDDGGNVVVIDPKGGEALRWTGVYRDDVARQAGLRSGIKVLDPCGLYPGLQSEALNPLDAINLNGRNYVSEVDKVIDALVVTTGNEREPVWTMSAKKTLRGILIHLLTRGRGPRPTLLDLQKVMSDGVEDPFILEMERNPAAQGLVRRCAAEIADLKVAENTWRGVKFQIDANIGFLDNVGVREAVSKTTFDLLDLRRRRMALYVVLPNKDKEALGRWLRLMYATIIDQVADIGGRRLHVVVDEFAALGRFERVLTDLATLRASNVHMHVAVQDLNQLMETYGNGWQTVVGNCALRQFLGVNENYTADYVSQALGPTTMLDGYDYQQRYPDEPPRPKPRYVGRPLMTPAEVQGMPKDRMLIFAERCARPLFLPKSPYYDSWWANLAVDITAHI